MDAFYVEASFPPSLAGNALLAMATIMSFWWVVLICLQWLYEIVDENRDSPAPADSYIATARRVRFWLVLSALTVALPRLIQLMLWQKLTPFERELVSVASWITVIPAAGMLVFAWWTNKRVVATERSYAVAHGFVKADRSTRQEKTRGIILLVGIFVIAFTTTFVRPQSDAPAKPSIVIKRQG